MYCHEEAVGVSIINSFNSYLGGTENTSGCSSVSPSGSSSSFIRVSTQVRSGLRWTGTWASHDLRTGSGQSGEGAGRSVGESRQDHKSDTIINGCLQQGVGFTLFCSQDAVWFVEYEAFWLWFCLEYGGFQVLNEDQSPVIHLSTLFVIELIFKGKLGLYFLI